MSDFPVKTFDFAVDNPQIQQGLAFTGDTVNLRAIFSQSNADFRIPNGAIGYLAIETGAGTAPYRIDGSVNWNAIIVKLTPEYVRGSKMNCWFAWEVDGQRSIRYPLTLTVKQTPYDNEPTPDPLPPPEQRWVGVADQESGKVSPPVVEARLAATQAAAAQAIWLAGRVPVPMPNGETWYAKQTGVWVDGKLYLADLGAPEKLPENF